MKIINSLYDIFKNQEAQLARQREALIAAKKQEAMQIQFAKHLLQKKYFHHRNHKNNRFKRISHTYLKRLKVGTSTKLKSPSGLHFHRRLSWPFNPIIATTKSILIRPVSLGISRL